MVNGKVLFHLQFLAWIHLPKGAGCYEDSFECCPGYERGCSPLGHVHRTLFTEPKRGKCRGPVAKPYSWPSQAGVLPLSVDHAPVFGRRCSCWRAGTPPTLFAWMPLTAHRSTVGSSLDFQFWPAKRGWRALQIMLVEPPSPRLSGVSCSPPFAGETRIPHALCPSPHVSSSCCLPVGQEALEPVPPDLTSPLQSIRASPCPSPLPEGHLLFCILFSHFIVCVCNFWNRLCASDQF